MKPCARLATAFSLLFARKNAILAALAKQCEDNAEASRLHSRAYKKVLATAGLFAVPSYALNISGLASILCTRQMAGTLIACPARSRRRMLSWGMLGAK